MLKPGIEAEVDRFAEPDGAVMQVVSVRETDTTLWDHLPEDPNRRVDILQTRAELLLPIAHTIAQRLVDTVEGNNAATDVSMKRVSSHAVERPTAPHTEAVHRAGSVIPYLIITCINAASEGDQTFVMNGKTVAEEILKHDRNLSDATIRYSGEDEVVRPLFQRTSDGSYGIVYAHSSELPNASQSEIVTTHSGSSFDIGVLDTLVNDAILDPSSTTFHRWMPGDMLMIKNARPEVTSLHGRPPVREAFLGERQIVRFRVADPSAPYYPDADISTDLTSFITDYCATTLPESLEPA